MFHVDPSAAENPPQILAAGYKLQFAVKYYSSATEQFLGQIRRRFMQYNCLKQRFLQMDVYRRFQFHASAH